MISSDEGTRPSRMQGFQREASGPTVTSKAPSVTAPISLARARMRATSSGTAVKPVPEDALSLLTAEAGSKTLISP